MAGGHFGGSRCICPQGVLLRKRLAGLLDSFLTPQCPDLVGLMGIVGDILHRLGAQGVGIISLRLARLLRPLFEDVRDPARLRSPSPPIRAADAVAPPPGCGSSCCRGRARGGEVGTRSPVGRFREGCGHARKTVHASPGQAAVCVQRGPGAAAWEMGGWRRARSFVMMSGGQA